MKSTIKFNSKINNYLNPQLKEEILDYKLGLNAEEEDLQNTLKVSAQPHINKAIREL